MPPNMRSILAQVHQKSLSMQSRRSFSSPASKEPKKSPKVFSVVTGTLGFTTGIVIGYHLSLEGGL